jgi:hypothetical protein
MVATDRRSALPTLLRARCVHPPSFDVDKVVIRVMYPRYLAIMVAGVLRAVDNHCIPILTTLACQIIGDQIRYAQHRDPTSNSRAVP